MSILRLDIAAKTLEYDMFVINDGSSTRVVLLNSYFRLAPTGWGEGRDRAGMLAIPDVSSLSSLCGNGSFFPRMDHSEIRPI